MEVAKDMIDAVEKDDGSSEPVQAWEFVSPDAIVDEYMENMYRLVSQI